MQDRFLFSEILERFVEKSGYSGGHLARSTGIPKATLANWLQGRVRKPRKVEDLLKLAAALHLDEEQTSSLLQAAGYPSLDQLRAGNVNGDNLELLAPWSPANRQADNGPFQAIADLPYFVGREKELRILEAALLDGGEVRICCLHGMGGTGKTALAAHFAYRYRSRFPDGVLWARLDISDTLSILDAFARAYGYDGGTEMDIGGRSQVVREILADRQALLVLDNARSSAEIRSLLPPSGPCAVIVTSRRLDLAACWGAPRVEVGPFSSEGEEALALFTAILGQERVRAEGAALRELADLLGHLPLAIAIAASRLAYEPGHTATEFVQRIRDESSRLEALACEDQSVRVSFGLSYETLGTEQKRLFAALGALKGEDFSVAAAAAAAGISRREAHEQLRLLYNLSLVHGGHAQRYRLHPLLHDFAAEAIGDEAVLPRTVAYFLNFLDEHQSDFDALDRELDDILNALDVAWEQQLLSHQIDGVIAVWPLLQTKGLYKLAEHHLLRAEEAARRLNDIGSLLRLLEMRGQVARIQGDYQRATEHLLEGLALAQASEDSASKGALLRELGLVADMRADYDQAATYFHEAVAHIPPDACPEAARMMLMALTTFELTRGDCAAASCYAALGLKLARESGQPRPTGEMLLAAGMAAYKSGHYDRARRYLAEGLAVARTIEYGEIIACSLMGLGIVAGRCGSFMEGNAYLHEGLEIAREVGHSWSVGRLLNEWGEVCLECGEPAVAREAFQEALIIARETGAQALLGEALYGKARIAAWQGQADDAKQLGRRSLTILEAVGHYQAPWVGSWLAVTSRR